MWDVKWDESEQASSFRRHRTPSIASPFSIKLDFDLNQIRSGSQRNKQNGKNLLPIQEVLASDAVIDDDDAGMISEDKNTVIEMPD